MHVVGINCEMSSLSPHIHVTTMGCSDSPHPSVHMSVHASLTLCSQHLRLAQFLFNCLMNFFNNIFNNICLNIVQSHVYPGSYAQGQGHLFGHLANVLGSVYLNILKYFNNSWRQFMYLRIIACHTYTWVPSPEVKVTKSDFAFMVLHFCIKTVNEGISLVLTSA